MPSSSSDADLFPRHLVYWINSIPKDVCVLFENKLTDTIDGWLLVAVVCHIYGYDELPSLNAPGVHATTPMGRTRAALCLIGQKEGWTNLPAFMLEKSFVDVLCENFSDTITTAASTHALFEYLSSLYKSKTERLKERENVREKESENLSEMREKQNEELVNILLQKSLAKDETRRRERRKNLLGSSLTSPIRTYQPSSRYSPEPFSRFLANSSKAFRTTRSISPSRSLSVRPKSEPLPLTLTSDSCSLSLSHSNNRIPDAAAPSYYQYAGDINGCRARRLDNQLLNLSLRNRAQQWLAEIGLGSRAHTYTALSALSVDSVPKCRAISAGSALPNFIRQPSFSSDQPEISLSNEWTNGLVLSEIAAHLMLPVDREQVKEQQLSCDLLGRRPAPRLLIRGTSTLVKSQAQATQNLSVALSALRYVLAAKGLDGCNRRRKEVCRLYDEGYEVGVIDITAHELLTGQASIWDDVIYKLFFLLSPSSSSTLSYEKENVSPVALPSKPSLSFSLPTTSCENSSVIATCKKQRTRRLPLRPKIICRLKKSQDTTAGTSPSSPSSPLSPPLSSLTTSKNKIQATTTTEVQNAAASPVPPAAVSSFSSSNLSSLKQSVSKTKQKPSHFKGQRVSDVVSVISQLPSSLPLTSYEQQLLAISTFPTVSLAQQQRVAQWLLSQGFVLLAGEGGFYGGRGEESPRPEMPLSVLKDKLRNGVMLCDLFLLLEPNASLHANLSASILRRPLTLIQARRNVIAALWLFRLRRCPPLSVKYLLQPDEILKGHKDILWGLLHEIMLSCDTCIGSGGETVGVATAQLQQLHLSLLQWMERKHVLSSSSSHETSPSLLSHATELFNGTLLCSLVLSLLPTPAFRFNTQPRTHSQAKSNLYKALDRLSCCADMGRRHLVSLSLSADLLAAGDWQVWLSLLQDMHRFDDRQTPRPIIVQRNESLYIKLSSTTLSPSITALSPSSAPPSLSISPDAPAIFLGTSPGPSSLPVTTTATPSTSSIVYQDIDIIPGLLSPTTFPATSSTLPSRLSLNAYPILCEDIPPLRSMSEHELIGDLKDKDNEIERLVIDCHNITSAATTTTANSFINHMSVGVISQQLMRDIEEEEASSANACVNPDSVLAVNTIGPVDLEGFSLLSSHDYAINSSPAISLLSTNDHVAQAQIEDWLTSLSLLPKTKRKTFLSDLHTGVLLVKLIQKLDSLLTFPGTYLRPKSEEEMSANRSCILRYLVESRGGDFTRLHALLLAIKTADGDDVSAALELMYTVKAIYMS